jgi:hypothetical protein
MKGMFNRVLHLFMIFSLMAVFSHGMNKPAAAARDDSAAELVGDAPAGKASVRKAEAAAIAEAVEQIKADMASQPAALQILFENGTLVNSPGTGAGGADESVLQNITLGMSNLGFGHQVAVGNRIADDFVVTGGPWDIKQIHFYAYQTASPLSPSPMTELYLQIWDGPPNDPASSVVWGDLTTNRLVSSSWSGIYRISESEGSGNIQRPIMLNVARINTTLFNGTYWLDWTVAGSDSFTGPWAPPITITGNSTTGNGLQFLESQGNWQTVLDLGTITPQGFPFVIIKKFPWILMIPAITSGGVK